MFKMFFKTILCVAISSMIIASSNAERKSIDFPPEAIAVIKEAFKICREKHGTYKDIVSIIREGSYKDDDAFKKLIHCAYVQSGFANPDGHVKIDLAVALYPKELNMLPVFKNCDKQGTDPADTTFLAFKCFQETSPVRMSLSNI